MNAALGIGNTKITITAIQDTVLKRFPMDSSDLSPIQKTDFKQGEKLAVIYYKLQENHYRFVSVDPAYLGHWYAFAPHVSIDDPNVVLTLEQLGSIALNTSFAKLQELLPYLNIAMFKYGITTRIRKCHFIAQTAHESDGFNTTKEYASGADYEWRSDLGNIYEGDGIRFKGRGIIQITGRANYAEVGRALGVNLTASPRLLEEPELACLSAGWFWDKHNLNIHADRDDLKRITRIINGGFNGLEDRARYLERAKKVL